MEAKYPAAIEQPAGLLGFFILGFRDDNFVYQTIFFSFLGCHKMISVSIQIDALQRLTGALC